AGLGVGGVAVALALQKILGDLFASLAIVLDKPFVLGDFIIVDDYLGSIENIGLKTTRVRSLSGEQLVFSNSDLLGSRIRNYGRMFERRVVFSIGVIYQTTKEQLQAIPGIIRTAIEAQDKTRFDRSHFQKYGDFSLDFETVYYVKSPDYNIYMDIQQAINLQIFEEFGKRGIEFAYPTQTLFVSREGTGAA
ncbi:MAG: mechanosensitive ion channel family protein, partial [Gemmatimonadales bacterium]